MQSVHGARSEFDLTAAPRKAYLVFFNELSKTLLTICASSSR